eukprot:gene20537-7504_t
MSMVWVGDFNATLHSTDRSNAPIGEVLIRQEEFVDFVNQHKLSRIMHQKEVFSYVDFGRKFKANLDMVLCAGSCPDLKGRWSDLVSVNIPKVMEVGHSPVVCLISKALISGVFKPPVMRQKLKNPDDIQLREWNDRVKVRLTDKSTDVFEKVGVLSRSAKRVFGVLSSSKDKVLLRQMPLLDLLQELQTLASSANIPKNLSKVRERFAAVLNSLPTRLKKKVTIPGDKRDILGCLRKFLEAVTYDALLEGNKAVTSTSEAKALKSRMFFNCPSHFRRMWKL